MTTSAIKVCPSTQLVDGGLAFKLPVQLAGEATTAFFVRYKGNVYGYLNRCPHMGSQLDWEGHVFTRAGDQLMCARHGATFSPDTGRSEEHTSELQSLMRISYAVFCLKTKKNNSKVSSYTQS